MNKRLFAIGDIHGCFHSLTELIEQRIQIRKDDKIVFLGDYIDRGPHSKDVIDFIIGLRDDGFEIIPLLGNHEAMLLDAYMNKGRLSQWLLYGGSETLNSFRIKHIREMEPKYVRFFKELVYYYPFEKFLFVHAGFNDEANNPFEDEYHMIWERSEKYQHPIFLHKTIVHGHSPIPESQCRNLLSANNQVLNIDTGCVYKNMIGYGKLTAIELYSKVIFSV